MSTRWKRAAALVGCAVEVSWAGDGGVATGVVLDVDGRADDPQLRVELESGGIVLVWADRVTPFVPDFTPDEVDAIYAPLVGTFGRYEPECAARLIVAVCQARGAWGPVTGLDLETTIRRRADVSRWFRNPVFRPDLQALRHAGAIAVPPAARGAMVLRVPFFAALRPRALFGRECRFERAASLRWTDDGGAAWG